MDTRRWGSSKSQFCLKSLFLICFFVQHASADYSPILDSQGLSESVADSRNKLEALNHLPLLYNSEQDMDYKRSSAFFPLRGKKLTAVDMDTANYPFMSQQGESEEKRSQFYPLRGKKIPDELKRGSYFMPMRGRKDDESWSEDEESVDKRMSSFMPMRGKRKSGFMDTFPHLGKPGTYSTEIMYPSSSGSNRKKRNVAWTADPDIKTIDPSSMPTGGNKTDHLVQKRSVSFMPMRGRREPFGSQEIKTRLLEKKQFSFMPMRGRRYPFNGYNSSISLDLKLDDAFTTPSSQSEPSFSDTNPQTQLQDDNDKKAASFMPMRGRRTPYDDSISAEYGITSEDVKRLSNFMPMRGRKNNINDMADTSNERIYAGDKRSSFMPMRGRRKIGDSMGLHDHDTDSDDKRASSFMPMRGRREFLEDLNNFNDFSNKRGSYFMPMRGRRSIEQPFSGNQMELTRDKRSSSFMPMRGRRMDSSDEDSIDKKSSSFMPMRGRRNFEDKLMQNLEDKRASYFMPMRGRRGVFDTAYYYNASPYVFSSGIGSSLMTRHYNGDVYPVSSVRRYVSKTRKFDWDSVKRAFHATRGKRFEVDKDSEEMWESEEREQDHPSKSDNGEGCRYKRSIIRPRMPLKPYRQYIALKRPMSFFATRGKRLDDSAIDSTASKLR